jgi:hypothetical protein
VFSGDPLKPERPFGLSPVQTALARRLALLIPAGFLTKAYRGPLQAWVEGSLGGVLYEMFWIWLVSLLFPRWRTWIIVVSVLAATSVIEAGQLWHPAFLVPVRRSFIGRTLIGTSFSWLDFPHYVLGCAIGGAWIGRLKKKNTA